MSAASRRLGQRVAQASATMLIAVLAACGAADPGGSVVDPAAVGDVRAGRAAIETHGCASCHNIPGISGADATVGPPLDDWAQRDRKSTRLNSSHECAPRMPSSTLQKNKYT